MKAQSKITARCGNRLRPSGRLHRAANARPSNPVSGQPILTIRARHSEEIAFAVELHLQVQSEIEERAHRFWFANGCASNGALNDWLKSENEVVVEFAKIRQPCEPAQSASFLPKDNYINSQRKTDEETK